MLEIIVQLLAVLLALWFFFLRGDTTKPTNITIQTTVTERIDSTSVVQQDIAPSTTNEPAIATKEATTPKTPTEVKKVTFIEPQQPKPKPNPQIQKQEIPMETKLVESPKLTVIDKPTTPKQAPLTKLEVKISENPQENLLDARSQLKSRTILESEVKGKRSSFQGKRRSTQKDLSKYLEELSSSNDLDAPDASNFKELCDQIKREEFEKANLNGRKAQLKEYGNTQEEPPKMVPIMKGTGAPNVPPPMPTQQQLGSTTGTMNTNDGKIKANELLAMKDLLKKTKK